MKEELVKSPVVFDEEQHTYTLEDKQLSGITSIIRKLLFPDMYNGISQATLDKAAERGTTVHHNIQLWVAGFNQDNEELQPFVDAFVAAGLNGLKAEYLVSDNETVASSIDMVCLDKSNHIILCDIKTTSVLHIEYLQWQLSIYAYLFERQNPFRVVDGLKAIHVRGGKCNIVDIQRLPDEYVEALLNAYRNGDETFNNPLHVIPDDLDAALKAYADNEQRIAEAKAVTDILDARKKELQEQVVKLMGENNMTKTETPIAKVTITPDSTKDSFDLKAFKESELFKKSQDSYKDFIKTSSVKGRVTITLK